MNEMSHELIEHCYEKLNESQKKLFMDYGLRQIKWMFEKDSVMQSKVPDGSILVGLSLPFMRWTAIDYENKIRYGYFKGQDPEWSEANNFGNVDRFDKVEDFKFIYNLFNLKNYDFDALTHVHRTYLDLDKVDC